MSNWNGEVHHPSRELVGGIAKLISDTPILSYLDEWVGGQSPQAVPALRVELVTIERSRREPITYDGERAYRRGAFGQIWRAKQVLCTSSIADTPELKVAAAGAVPIVERHLAEARKLAAR